MKSDLNLFSYVNQILSLKSCHYIYKRVSRKPKRVGKKSTTKSHKQNENINADEMGWCNAKAI